MPLRTFSCGAADVLFFCAVWGLSFPLDSGYGIMSTNSRDRAAQAESGGAE